MEIRIKTAEEFWLDKVSIEISGTAAEVQTVGEHITRGRTAGYWADACEKAEHEVHELKGLRAGDAGTIEALREKVADLETELERYRKAHVCTVECKPNAHTAFTGRTIVAELETALADAQTRIGELDGELRRALREMERRFTTAQVADAKAGAREDARAQLQREVIAPLEDKLARIHTAVLGTELARELTTYRDSSAAMLLVEALAEVRRITGVTSV